MPLTLTPTADETLMAFLAGRRVACRIPSANRAGYAVPPGLGQELRPAEAG